MTTSRAVQIASDDPRRDDVRGLLEGHLVFAREHSPPEDVHALDVDLLVARGLTFVSARDGDELLGVGAVQRLDDGPDSIAEIKSMHTAAAARGLGVGAAVLAHLLGVAREWGVGRVSLETGSMEAFAPARRMYAAAGFVECEPFGDYGPSSFSTFMTREL